MTGTLFVVATPIGNLEDITFRAVRTLREADVVAAEDTRRTLRLLTHFQIRRPIVSLHEHNEGKESARLLHRLRGGESVALVSDAGTPAIADPGAHLVRLAHEAGIKVVPIPGPSAVAAAVSVAGLDQPEFVFMGFPPRSGTERSEWFHRAAAEDRPFVAFEAPHRIRRTLTELQVNMGERQIVICREVSKINESCVVQPISSVSVKTIPEIGEFVLVVGAKENSGPDEHDAALIKDLIGVMTNSWSIDLDDALGIAARGLRTSPTRLRKALKQHRYATRGDGRAPT